MSRGRESLRAWLALLKTSQAMKKAVDTTFRANYGLSISRFDVLAALDRARGEGMRAGALSEMLMVTEGNTTQVTAPLIRDGLVKRTVCRDDARVAYFRLTAKGARIFNEMAAGNRQLVRDAFAGLSPNELQTLKTLLAKIRPPERCADQRENAA